ncbi:MAG: hypothetical protein HMLKMBBP_00314 [Planctomycetes bacterium]|nr:hypothetical protein [Planctomycetota bacterium]
MEGNLRVRTLERGDVVEMWRGDPSSPGKWVGDVGVTGDAAAVLPFDGAGRLRTLGGYEVTSRVDVLESVAAPLPPNTRLGIGGTGGATQYFAPNLPDVLQRIPVR